MSEKFHEAKAEEPRMLSGAEYAEKFGVAIENLRIARVSDWKFKDGYFTGDQQKHTASSRGFMWRFRTNIAPNEGGSVPFLRELVKKLDTQDPQRDLEEMRNVSVRGLEGMEAVYAGMKDSEGRKIGSEPFVEAAIIDEE